MKVQSKRILPIEEAMPMLCQVNRTRCLDCVHRMQNTYTKFNCGVTALTMVNDKNECIWFEKGKISYKGLNIELAKKRMHGEPLYLSTMDVI